MRLLQDQINLSASDLVGHLNCEHLTSLDIQVVEGDLAKPKHWDPLLEILRKRGFQHEKDFIDFLESQGLDMVKIKEGDISDSSINATIEAMRSGVDIIVQGVLRHGRWSGRTDILRKVDKPSTFGNWSYEVIDTKLARKTKGGTVLQLCLYSDLLRETQKCQPEYTYVVAHWSNFIPQEFRVDDYVAYFRKAKAAIEEVTQVNSDPILTYPEPKDHCDICRWYDSCDKRRRTDDHLSFVAGISNTQIAELRENNINKLQELAMLPTPLEWKPKRGSIQSYEKIQKQAHIQAEAREIGELRHELLSIKEGYGLCLLPEPSKGDIFFDLEGNPYIGEHGIEYLFGYHFHEEDGSMNYIGDWAYNREQEKEIFEKFMDFVTDRINKYPDLHIYHFGSYEQSALKRIMGRYATRESEVDDLLRGQRFVDLYSVVRNGLRASVESYSIKRLEGFYGYERKITLRQANIALTSFNAGLELGDIDSITDSDKEIVKAYNKDDCVSTAALHLWLEELRAKLISEGNVVSRPLPGQDGASEEISERQKKVNNLIEILTKDIPVDKDDRSPEEQAKWVLANILDWHRREDKPVYWELFRLQSLNEEDLFDDRAGLSGLTFIKELPLIGKKRIPTHRYSFSQQDTDIREGKDLYCVGGEKLGSVIDIYTEERTIDIQKTNKSLHLNPEAIFTHEMIRSPEQADCLLRIGEYISQYGMSGGDKFLTARDLLLGNLPRIKGQDIKQKEENTFEAAMRLSQSLEGGILPIQGPPGTGKSYTASRMICSFVKQGLKVGITANSHKVIRGLLDKVVEAAEEANINLSCIQKSGEKEENQDRLTFTKDSKAFFESFNTGEYKVFGATSFSWAREEAFEILDVLVVDEAAQMSLANVLAVSHSAKRLILLGDTQQLDQPTQGTHPDGTGVSSLEHILGDHKTIEPDRGLFLAETWRMSPKICAFDSELFYENKLYPVDGCSKQKILSDGPIKDAGLRYINVTHSGNKSYSSEEADVVEKLVRSILDSNSRWVDRDGIEKPITPSDILIITPYNAQVFEIQQRLPGFRVGTVDKFQGQEAPISIYSMATSSHADAPRGMEFLYSSNRFNVAISRAKCISILVSSPEIFEADCKTPRQMQLVNAFCRYLELAERINI